MMYGLPYQGSKNRIAEQIIGNLPKAEHFYDVFGGGGAITHCAILSCKYKYVHYNELNPLICKAFRMAINGDFRNNTQWVSREDFNNLKKIDPFVAICWSFGNNLNMYMYGKEKEPWKKALHWLYINQNDSLMRSFGLNPPVFYSRTEARAWIRQNKQEIKQKYISWYKKTFLTEIEFASDRIEKLQSLESLERLKSLERRILITNNSYKDLSFEQNSVIYCDPPYKNTKGYNNSEFDFDKFESWVESQKQTVFISEQNEYSKWNLIWCKDIQNRYANGNKSRRFERLYAS